MVISVCWSKALPSHLDLSLNLGHDMRYFRSDDLQIVYMCVTKGLDRVAGLVVWRRDDAARLSFEGYCTCIIDDCIMLLTTRAYFFMHPRWAHFIP